MRKSLLFTSLLLLILSFFSCKKGLPTNLENISYGTSFGMCVGYCVNTLSINQEAIVFSKAANRPTPDTKTCTSKNSVKEFVQLETLFDQDKVLTLPETIGCPDCADGGAEWVSITKDGKTHKVVFEYGKAPAELAAIVAKLKAIKETFKECN